MRIITVYRVFCSHEDIGRKAEALAIEQSVEMPVEAITDQWVRDEIVGRLDEITDCGDGSFRVSVALSAATVGAEPGQLMNMLFGNSSIHEDVTLEDVDLPLEMLEAFGGPRAGIAGLRHRVGKARHALTCAAIKPQGLSPAALADLTFRFALGRIDFIKDDHALADQAYAPFRERVIACADASRRAVAETGHPTRYVPNVSGNLDQLREQTSIALGEGLDTLLIAPMLVGLPAFHTIRRENPGMAFIAHPAFAGAARIAPQLLLGKLFRLFGADAVIFPHHGGRFGYSSATCAALADIARAPLGTLLPSMPVPAGGMTLDRLAEILKFYGEDTMILIGGGLLAAGDRLTEQAASFVAQVEALSAER
jgi:ribulose-bisphosphate carboxylase large chain